MAALMSRKRSKKTKANQPPFFFSMLHAFIRRIPALFFLLVIMYLWTSSTTVIAGNIVHVCVSSRKLNNLYCLSAGNHPNFEIPSSITNNTSFASNNGSTFRVEGFLTNKNSTALTTVGSSGKRELPELAHIWNADIDNDKEEAVETNDVSDTDGFVGNATSSFIPFLVTNNRERNERDEEIGVAVKVVEEQLQIQRSWRSDTKHASCEGRGIYVYDLPLKFNKDLVDQCGDMVPWADFCKYFSDDALGEPIPKIGKGWYRTHQYSLEPILHSRVLKHPCRVYNENEARLFYVPFYGGLDILRWHFKNVSTDLKDSLALELITWLERQKPWTRRSGEDHVFVLGKISWDFRRNDGSSWGSRLLELDQMQNPIKLLIERQPWHVNDIGIPHPTFFHPHSDDDIIAWQSKMMTAHRKNLVSFAGASRPDATDSIRSALIGQCTATDDICKFLNCSSGKCSDAPDSVIDLFMDSEFCLQPPGDSPTRKSVFDSLISGCIPVLFDPFTAYYQYPWHLPQDHTKYSVFIDQKEVRQTKVNVVEKLSKVSVKERENLRKYIIYQLLPGLVYGDASNELQKFQDAFSITMNTLIERVNKYEQMQ